jgi:hypothetical protein
LACPLRDSNQEHCNYLTVHNQFHFQPDTLIYKQSQYLTIEGALNTSNIYEAQQDTDYDFWISDHNVHTSISINNTLYNKCMNLLFLPENHHISILDGGADTCVLGKGWEVLSIHNSRRANVVGFDHETAIKRNLPIVTAITAIDLPSGESILLVIHEGIYNETAAHSLLSEFQLREFGINIDSICHRHGGTQQMTIKDGNGNDSDSDVLTIPLDLAVCMVHFKHRLPTAEEIASLQQYKCQRTVPLSFTFMISNGPMYRDSYLISVPLFNSTLPPTR